MQSDRDDDPDTRYMRRALQLASRGLGKTRPNPAVGAVVVKDGEIVGEGWHRRAGTPHAERIALEKASEDASGATIYVTLEPCSHPGNTPPCTRAIIDTGISRVVYACLDCDERCAGEAEDILRDAGIEVRRGILSDQAMRLNQAYFKHKTTGLPFVTLKMACSLDGKIATRSGDSKWVTGEESRRRVHQMRHKADAVMVGVGTVLADDPKLTTRLDGQQAADAIRIIVDSQARTPPDADVINVTSDAPCIIATTEAADRERLCSLRDAGADIVTAAADENGRVQLPDLMRILGRRNLMSILLEGGGTIAAAAVQTNIIDRIIFFYAPKLVGGERAHTALDGSGIELMKHARDVNIESVQRVGNDVMIEGYPCSQD